MCIILYFNGTAKFCQTKFCEIKFSFYGNDLKGRNQDYALWKAFSSNISQVFKNLKYQISCEKESENETHHIKYLIMVVLQVTMTFDNLSTPP